MQRVFRKLLITTMFAVLAANLYATLPTTITSIAFKGNDKATEFNCPFKAFNAEDVKCTLYDKAYNPTDLVLNKDYSVSNLNKNEGFIVKYPLEGDPLPTGYILLVQRSTPMTQDINLPMHSKYHPEVIEKALDKMMMTSQEGLSNATRALRFPLVDGNDIDPVLPAANLRKNKILAFDEKGKPVVSVIKLFTWRGEYKTETSYSKNDLMKDDHDNIYVALKEFVSSTINDDLEAGNIEYYQFNYSGNAIWIDGLRVILSGMENGDVIMYENGMLVPRSAGGNVKTVNSVGPDAHGNVRLTTDNLPEGEMESRKYLTQNNCNTLGVVRVEDPEKALKHGFVPRAAADGTQIEDAYPIQQDDEECFVHTVKILGQNQTVFPSRYLPHLNIGRMWVQKVGEYDKEQRWWYQLAKREDFQSDAESGDLCYAIDEGLHDWELHHDPIHGGIQISHEYYHNDPWSIQYIDHHNETYALAKAEVSSGKHVIKARHVRGGYWLYVTEDYAGQGVFEINIKVHYDNIVEAQNIPIYSAELADIKKNTWLYQEIETPEPLQHYNQIDAIEIKANVVTRGHESSGNIFLDDITVEFNIAENETDDPIWSKNYCPAIAPAHKWDIFACQDIDKAKHPSHESAKDDGWLDYEIPIGIQYINGHTGLTVELETGDIDEGLGSHGKVHKWLNDSNLKSIASFIDLKQDVITNADKIKEIIINIADMATKTWIKEQGYLKKGTDLEEYISKNPTVVANDERSKNNEENIETNKKDIAANKTDIANRYTKTEVETGWKVKTLTGNGGIEKVTDNGKGGYTITPARVANTNGNCQITSEGNKVDVTNDKKGNYKVKITPLGNDDNCVFLSHLFSTTKGKDVAKGRKRVHSPGAWGSLRWDNNTPFGSAGHGSFVGYHAGGNADEGRNPAVIYASPSEMQLWHSYNMQNNWTVECWIRPTAVWGNEGFIMGCHHIRPSNNEGGWKLILTPSNRLQGYIDWGGTAGCTHQTVVSRNEWHHVAMAKIGNQIRVFLDGVMSTQHPNVGVPRHKDPNVPFSIGGQISIGGFCMGGNICEVRVSNCVRYTKNFIPPTQPFGPDYTWIYDKNSGICVNHIEGEEYDRSIYTDVPAPSDHNFYTFIEASKRWTIHKDSITSAIDIITDKVHTATDTYLSNKSWADTDIPKGTILEKPKLAFETKNDAKEFIRTLQNKSVEELIKLL